MNEVVKALLDGERLKKDQFLYLLENRDLESDELIFEKAREKTVASYGDRIFLRGLVEITNVCKNDCLYCGIRASNSKCERYRLTKADVLDCVKMGAEIGFKSFVFQGGEDPHFDDALLCELVRQTKELCPGCAVTLSMGERSRESYKALKDAGADRYLLRHETADSEHYSRLHPKNMNLKNRMDCLYTLKELGYQTGCGMMVQSPFQSNENLACDLEFIASFQPQMCGIGPFIPHKDTPFAAYPAGSVDLTVFLLALVRLSVPHVLLPATTAVASLDPKGRTKAVMAGANVVMPNLSPEDVKDKYSLYNNKLSRLGESALGISDLREEFSLIGRRLAFERGDWKH